MLTPATKMIDYVKAQVANSQSKKFRNPQKKLLWILLALFTALLCWGLLKNTKSRKRKPKAALW